MRPRSLLRDEEDELLEDLPDELPELLPELLLPEEDDDDERDRLRELTRK